MSTTNTGPKLTTSSDGFLVRVRAHLMVRLALFAVATGSITAGAAMGYSSTQNTGEHRSAVNNARSENETLQQATRAQIDATNELRATTNYAMELVGQTSAIVTGAVGFGDATTLGALASAGERLAAFVRDHPGASSLGQSSDTATTGGVFISTTPARAIDDKLSTEEINETARRLRTARETIYARREKIDTLTREFQANASQVEGLIVEFAHSVQANAGGVIAATQNADEATKTRLAESLARLSDAIAKGESLAKFLDDYVAEAKAAQAPGSAHETRRAHEANAPKSGGEKKKPEAPDSDGGPAGPPAPPGPISVPPAPAGVGAPPSKPTEERRAPPAEPFCKSKGTSGAGCSDDSGTPPPSSTPVPSSTPGTQSGGGWSSFSFLRDWVH